MKAMEFQAALNADRTLSVPDNIAGSIPLGHAQRVLILMPESDTDQEWEQCAAVEFGLGYSESDAIYDQLSAR
jgi:hypothetical protein